MSSAAAYLPLAQLAENVPCALLIARSDPIAQASLPEIRARIRPGTAMAAMIPIIATTMSSSIRVKPRVSVRINEWGRAFRPGPLLSYNKNPDRLLNRRGARRRRAVAAARADRRGGLPDRAGRVREEEPGAGRRRQRIRPGVIAGRQTRRAVAGGGAGRGRAGHRDRVPALGHRRAGAQVRADERRTARRAGAEGVETLSIQTVRAARGERRLRAADSTERPDRRSFVTGNAGPQQSGHRNRGDDADDRDNDQQLDEGETLLATNSHFMSPQSKCTLVSLSA